MKISIKLGLSVLSVLSALLFTQHALANAAVHLDKAPIDASNHESLQRGARTFVNNCLNCHSANYMRYNRLLAIGLTEKQIKDNLLFAGEKVGDTMKVALNPEEAKKMVWRGAA